MRRFKVGVVKRFASVLLSVGMLGAPYAALAAEPQPPAAEPEYYAGKPLMERYVLDELKALRSDMQETRVEVTERVTKAELTSSDRAIRYASDTLNNIFLMITAAATLLVLLGWRSLAEVKNGLQNDLKARVGELTQTYEARLQELEEKLKIRSDQILANQEGVTRANHIHALWRRIDLEDNPYEKLKIIDQILSIEADNTEAMAFKADKLLEIDDFDQALSWADRAIKRDPEFASAYWQRACAHAQLGSLTLAMDDIRHALMLSPKFAQNLATEPNFEPLKESTATSEQFSALMPSAGA